MSLREDVLGAFLSRPDLVNLISHDTREAAEALREEAEAAGTPIENPGEVVAALLAAIAASEPELARHLHDANVIRLLEELHAGLGFVLGELLEELLAVRSILEPGTRRADQLSTLVAESEARVVQLLVALGVERNLAGVLATDRGVGFDIDPVEGEGLVLTAVAGSGKSLTAIRTHQVDLVDAALDPHSPVPVLLDARVATKAVLRDLILDRCNMLGDPTRVGVRMVLDGLDEISRSTAQALLSDALVLVSSWPRSSVVAFSRPDVKYHGVRSALLPLPLAADLEDIAAQIAGRPSPFRDLPRALRQSVALPLYAVATAVLLRRRAEIPQSPASIIGSLIDICLKDADVQDEAALIRLAVTLVEHQRVAEGDFGPEAALQVSKSRLVLREEGYLRFAAPIYQDWFASKSLFAGGISNFSQPFDPWAFDRWRYPLALALAGGSAEVVDVIAAYVMGQAPASFRLLLNDATTSATTRIGSLIQPSEPEARLSFALKSTHAPLAPVLATAGQDALDPARTEVQVESGWASLDIRNEAGLRLRHHGTPVNAREPAWPWRLAAGELAVQMDSVLDRRLLPLDDPLADAEAAWLLARILSDDRSLLHRPIEPSMILDYLDGADRAMASEPVLIVGRSSAWLPAGTLARVKRMLEEHAERGVLLERPWPTPDNWESSGGWTDGLYTPLTGASILEGVLTTSLRLYRLLVDTVFPMFAPYFSHYATLPALIRCVYSPRANDMLIAQQTVTWHPLAPREQSRVAIAISERSLRPPREQETSVAPWEAVERRPPPFSRAYGLSSGIVRALHSNRPATHQAYRWLIRDLDTLGWREKAAGLEDPD